MSHPQNSKALVMSNTLSDAYKVVGYSRKAGVKVLQQLVPAKYKMQLGDIKIDFQGIPKSGYTQPNTVFVKEPGVYCFRY